MKITVAPLALLVCISHPVMAGTIEYSWVGRILTEEVNQDPWEIGAAGKPFFISATVDENARPVFYSMIL